MVIGAVETLETGRVCATVSVAKWLGRLNEAPREQCDKAERALTVRAKGDVELPLRAWKGKAACLCSWPA